MFLFKYLDLYYCRPGVVKKYLHQQRRGFGPRLRSVPVLIWRLLEADLYIRTPMCIRKLNVLLRPQELQYEVIWHGFITSILLIVQRQGVACTYTK